MMPAEQLARLQEWLDQHPVEHPKRPSTAAEIAAENYLESVAEDRQAEQEMPLSEHDAQHCQAQYDAWLEG